jgi:hypothetical protein
MLNKVKPELNVVAKNDQTIVSDIVELICSASQDSEDAPCGDGCACYQICVTPG